MGTISSIINILFETWFVYYMLKGIKNIDSKKKRLFIFTLISYLLSSIIIGFTYKNQIYMLILYSTILFILIKILYKKKVQILDVFLIYYLTTIILITAIITQLIFSYTIKALIIDRIILLLIALFTTKKIKKIYDLCKNNWNRGENHKVKSITLRNILILGMNFTLFILNNYLLGYLISIL